MGERSSWIADLRRYPTTWPFEKVGGNRDTWIQKRPTLEAAAKTLMQRGVMVTGYPAQDSDSLVLAEKMTDKFRGIMYKTHWGRLSSDWLETDDETTFSQFLEKFVEETLANPQEVRSLYRETLPEWQKHQGKIKELSETFDLLGQYILKRISDYEKAFPDFTVMGGSGLHLDALRADTVHQDAPAEGRNFIAILEPIVGNGPMFAKSKNDRKLMQFEQEDTAMFYGDTYHVADLDNWGPRAVLHFILYHRKNHPTARTRGTKIKRTQADQRP